MCPAPHRGDPYIAARHLSQTAPHTTPAPPAAPKHCFPLHPKFLPRLLAPLDLSQKKRTRRPSPRLASAPRRARETKSDHFHGSSNCVTARRVPYELRGFVATWDLVARKRRLAPASPHTHCCCKRAGRVGRGRAGQRAGWRKFAVAFFLRFPPHLMTNFFPHSLSLSLSRLSFVGARCAVPPCGRVYERVVAGGTTPIFSVCVCVRANCYATRPGRRAQRAACNKGGSPRPPREEGRICRSTGGEIREYTRVGGHSPTPCHFFESGPQ